MPRERCRLIKDLIKLSLHLRKILDRDSLIKLKDSNKKTEYAKEEENLISKLSHY